MKLKNIFTMLLISITLVGCGGTGTTSSNSTSNNEQNSNNPVKENIVKIRSINASEAEVEPVSVKARNRKEANDAENEDNYIIITKDVTDVQFTITLDNPEAYGIDALRVSCDDPEAQIQVEGEWKPISQEANGTRVVNWSSEDPYEKTYNIRTTSLEDLYTFKVVDIRLAGHDTFLSKQTNSTDFGNNELDIYKMDTDAYELDVVSNTFEEIKFGIKVKEGVTNLSNFKVDGKEPDENGYWVMNESKEDCRISYDFELKNGMKVRRESENNIELLNVNLGIYDRGYGKPMADYSLFLAGDQCGFSDSDFGGFEEWINMIYTEGYFEIYMLISGTGGVVIPEMWIGDVKLENVKYVKTKNGKLPYVYYCIMPEFNLLFEGSTSMNTDVLSYMVENFRFKINDKTYKVVCSSSGRAVGYEEV